MFKLNGDVPFAGQDASCQGCQGDPNCNHCKTGGLQGASRATASRCHWEGPFLLTSLSNCQSNNYKSNIYIYIYMLTSLVWFSLTGNLQIFAKSVFLLWDVCFLPQLRKQISQPGTHDTSEAMGGDWWCWQRRQMANGSAFQSEWVKIHNKFIQFQSIS